MATQAQGTQPQRKSARIKSAQTKAGKTQSQDAQRTLPDVKPICKKQKVVGVPKRGWRRRAIDVETEDLPTRISRGSLGRLLDSPLDILLEIFTHLMPGDLLKVACINKSFSELLLSRRSISIWRAMLDAASLKGYPPKPEEWTELAWVQLVSGSKLCGICGGMTTFDISWSFRMRLCRACRNEHIVSCGSVSVEHKLRDKDKDIKMILPSCTVESRWGRAYSYILADDVLAYHGALEDLSHEFQDEDTFLAKREELDAEMIEDTRLVMDHAKLCEEGAERFKNAQVVDNDEQIITRVTRIYERLLDLGFEAADLEEPLIRQHKDVNNPRPLTKEAWERLRPNLIELAKKARDTRLKREKVERRQAREKVVATEYRAFLRRVAPSTISLMPTMDDLLRLPPVCTAVADDEGETDTLHKTVAQALVASLPSISEFITNRADAFRTAIPITWPVARLDQGVSATSSTSVGPTTQHELDLRSSLLSLDLAVYAFSCGQTSHAVGSESCKAQFYYGLEVLAHLCPLSGSADVKFKPLPTYHLAVLRVLKLLQLDPTSTTVVMLDTLDPALVDSSLLTDRWTQTKTYKLLTWRQAVERVTNSIVNKTAPCVRLLTPAESQWFNAEVVDKGGRTSGLPERTASSSASAIEYLPVWGCSKCSAHLDPYPNTLHKCSSRDEGYVRLCASYPDDPWRWFRLSQVRTHLAEAHNTLAVHHREGQDYFLNRHVSRRRQTGFPLIPAKLSAGEAVVFA
ncbi:hypothetical protein PENSPDRAFT_646920 [Peniophora sp. CONT]|nr:hypothetical protein PENSPDRAFT_646920 [Peniophora sp. CONT]